MKFKYIVLLAALTGCAAPVKKNADTTFRVMTYNIQHGAGMDRKVDLLRLAAAIKHEKPDIVAMQEVDKGVARTDRRDLTAELAALTGMTGVFSNNFHYQGGEYGNAILSRFPVLERTNLHYHMLHPNEQRGALQATLDVHGKKLLFIATHLDYRPEQEERLLNVAELKQIVTHHANMPVIICGDFNSNPDSGTAQAAAEFLTDSWPVVNQTPGFTFPAGNPTARIDFLWITKDTLAPIKAWVPVTEASDHRPVVMDFKLK